MSDRFLHYLEREHARLQAVIDASRASRTPDEAAIARLKKQMVALKDQIAQWQRDCSIAA